MRPVRTLPRPSTAQFPILVICIAVLILAGCRGSTPTVTVITTVPSESTPTISTTPQVQSEPPALTGTVVYQAGKNGTFNVFVVTLPNGTPKQLTQSNDDLEPAWSPDGKQIVYACKQGDHHEICTMNPDGSNVTQVTTSKMNKWGPDWSPDGKQIAFVADDPPAAHIYILDLATKEVRPLLPSGTGDTSAPRWSPDGKSIAYTSAQKGFNLYQADVEGTKEQALTSFALDDRPAWSPDGKYIVFRRISNSSPVYNGNEIWRIDADGKNEKLLTTNMVGDDWPTFSPDGKWILYSSEGIGGQYFLQVLPTDGGIPAPLIAGGLPGTSGHWKP